MSLNTIKIIKPDLEHLHELTLMAQKTFAQSHGHSASATDIEAYIADNFSEANFETELLNPSNQYYLLYYNGILAGYSNVIFNQAIEKISEPNISKLSRIYFLDEFHGLGLGKALFEYNLQLAKENEQAGIWLFVWVENHRAISFYKKVGFEIVGSNDFRISENHSNPNHQMFLKF